MKQKHYVYILRCKDNSYYTGYTTDVKRRLEEHSNGTGAKYTRGRSPLELVYMEGFATRSLACKRESDIKRMTKEQKTTLIRFQPPRNADQ